MIMHRTILPKAIEAVWVAVYVGQLVGVKRLHLSSLCKALKVMSVANYPRIGNSH